MTRENAPQCGYYVRLLRIDQMAGYTLISRTLNIGLSITHWHYSWFRFKECGNIVKKNIGRCI